MIRGLFSGDGFEFGSEVFWVDLALLEEVAERVVGVGGWWSWLVGGI